MLVNHEPKASDFKSSPNTPSGLSRRKLSQKSFVGFHMPRDLSRLRRSQSAASRPNKARSTCSKSNHAGKPIESVVYCFYKIILSFL